MSNISIEQLAAIQHPEKHSLNAACHLTARRTKLKNFLGLAVYLLTFTLVARNKGLDSATKKISAAARKTLSEEAFSLERKKLTIKALRNLITMINLNSGSRHQEVNRLIEKVEDLSVRPAVALSLEEEVAKAKRQEPLRAPPTEHDWRAGTIGRHERKQTLQSYKAACTVSVKQRRTLNIHQLGQFTQTEKKALEIVADYLSAVHGMAAQLDPQTHRIADLTRQHKTYMLQNGHRLGDDFGLPRIRAGEAPQYHVGQLLDIAATQFVKGNRRSHSLCFIKDDLYDTDMNFLFGAARYNGPGVFSIHRYGDANGGDSKFKKCLLRLMKLASHEFAHMRFLAHCTDYSCNIQGANNIRELDGTPLHFCSEDMAKIAYCNGNTLKDSYKRQLAFLENFSGIYGVKIDFASEIAYLRTRIRALKN